ncbi:SDR family NAD(P)-dependent oxidoreductase [Desulfocicer niacini]
MGKEHTVVLITGSSRGIGKDLAFGFAREGYSVVVNYQKSKTAAEKIVEQIRHSGGKAICCQADVSERSEVVAMKDRILEEYSHIDILINNAGINKQNSFWDINDDEWDFLMKVNLKSVFICSQEFMPLMAKQKWGRVINMSSVSGQYGGPKTLHYATTKGAIIALTKGLARYGAPDNVLVNAVAPGIIKTDMTSKELKGEAGKAYIDKILLKKAGVTADVLQACLYLASEKQNYTTGHTINVNGGLYM